MRSEADRGAAAEASAIDARATPPDPFLGCRINSLFVKQRLAAGGMGVVYRAQHERSPHIQRVVKILLPEYARVPAIQQRFVREAEAAARLQHDNIIKIEDYGTLSDGQCYLVMDYLHGESLEDYLRRSPRLDPHQACMLLAQICSALQHAHDHGIVHRDLKPGNIFLTRIKSALRVVLLDFGIAKDIFARDGLATDTGMVLGTPAYMAVEQFQDASRVSPAADVYALAIIAWRMLTGELPWGLHSAPVLYRKQTTERPRLPPASVMSSELARVLLAALAVDPAARPPSMRAFAVAFASEIPAVPPELPSGAEILAAVASDLVIEAPHHERTLQNLSAQDRLGALLWSHRETEARSRASAGLAPSYRALPAPPADTRGEPVASALPQQPPMPIPHVPAAPRAFARRLGLGALALGLALLGGIVTFALARLVAGRSDGPAAADQVVQRAPSSIVPDARELAAPPRTAAAPAAPAAAPPLDAAPAPAPIVDAQIGQVTDAQIAPAPKTRPRPVTPAPRAPEPSARPGEPQRGVLVVRVVTWAEVYVDGKYQGTAPLRVTVPAGPHSVLLINDDHRETVPIAVSPAREAIIQKPW